MNAPINFKVEVVTDNSGKFLSNNILFANRQQAEDYAIDLHDRWTAVREWRVVEVPVPMPPEYEGEVA